MNEHFSQASASDTKLIKNPEAFMTWLGQNVADLVGQLGNITSELRDQNGILRQILTELANRDKA